MPLLKYLSGQMLVFVAAVALTGCHQDSPEYNKIKRLPYSQWDEYAITLPIERRLDLNNEIRERSGHTPKMTIEDAFSSEPSKTYEAIVKRIKKRDSNRYYLGIIYDIDGKNNFKICDQPDRKILQNYLSGIAGYPEHKKYQPSFYTC